MSACVSCVLPSSVLHDKRPPLQIDFDHVVGDDPRAEVERLLPHQLHQLGAGDGVLALVHVHVLQPLGLDRRLQKLLQIAGGKAGVVFDFGRQRELPQRQRAVEAVLFRDRAFEHQRLQLGPRRINGGRPAGRPAANDDHLFCHNRSSSSQMQFDGQNYRAFAEMARQL